MQTTKEEIVRLFCQTQVAEPADVLARLAVIEDKYSPEGFVLLENQLLDATRCGHRYILPFGPSNSMKSVPSHPFSIDGNASGTVVAIAVHLLPPRDGEVSSVAVS